MPTRSEDIRLIRMLREADILVDAKGHKLNSPNGVIMVSCPDGDQITDIFNHTVGLLTEGDCRVRPHMLNLHGGAMLIDHDCPLYREFRADELLMLSIAQARAMKEIDTIALLVHAPCGAAKMAGLNVIDVLHHVVRAKLRIKTAWPDIKIGCFFHVDYPDRKRTYFLSRDAFELWYKDHGASYASKSPPGNGADHTHPTEFPSPILTS